MNFQPIHGSGGQLGFNPAPSSGGGSKSQGVDALNTLRSNAFARIVELIGEGPIQGLINGGQSIYFNRTPVVNANNTVNFRGVQWEERTGLPDQTPMLGNATSSTQTSVGLQIQASVSPPVVTIEDPNATSAQVIVSVPSLFAQDNNGNVNTASVSWQVEVQPANTGIWQVVDTVSLTNQKCVSLYQHQSTFALPAGGNPWNIKVVRLTADSYTTNLQNATYFVSYTEIVAGNFVYPNSALVGLTIDASLFSAGSIPTRSFHVQGLIIQIPSNYDPTTRVYTGVWDGTFKSAYCNNPAWVLYDLLTNNRYGIGDFIDATKVDKWGLYTIAQYCDGLVPDGYGGQEPRYVFNGVLNNRQEAWKALQSITSCFRGMSYWSTGQVFATADMPADATKLVTPANVIDGHFNYSGSALKTRHSVAMVRWNDPTQFFAPQVEVVVSDAQLLAFGWRETTVTAIGCTSRGQANRMGRWILDTEQFSTETVEYVCAWDHIDVRPGAVIAVADPGKNGVRLGGRLLGVTDTTHVTMDQAFTPVSGQTYTLMVELPDGTIGSSAIASFDNTDTILTLSTALTALPLVGAMFVITASDVAPRQYRVTNIAETDKHTYKVTAIFYDPTKFARVEEAKPLAPIPYYLPKTTIEPPANFAVNETVYFANSVAQNRVTLSWTPADDFMAAGYLVLGQSPNGGGMITFGQTTGSSYDIDSPALGSWTFYVQSIGADGRQSTYVSVTFNVQGWASQPPPYVSHVEIFGQAGDDDFVGQNPHFSWINNFPGSTSDVGQETVVGAGNNNPFYRNNVLSIIDINSGKMLREEILYSDDYIYTYEKNVADNSIYSRGAQRTFKVSVAVQDTLGRISDDDIITASNPAPDLMIPSLASASGNIYVSWVNPADPDFVGSLVWASTNPNFDPLSTAPAYQGSNNFFVFPGQINTTYYVRLAGYDVFGLNNLNISPPIEIICSGYQPDTAPPVVPTNLALTSGVTTMPTGEVVQTLTANWDASPSLNFAYFEIAIEAQGGAFISDQTAINTYTWSSGLIAGATYNVQVRAWSQSGYDSSWCATVSVTMPAKSTAPGAPTALSIVASLKAAYLTWTNPTDPDLDHIEIWQGATTTLGGATKIGSSYGTGFTVSGLTTGQTYNYWIRAFNTSGIASTYIGPITVTPGQVANGDIAANAITADKILANTITGDRISVSTNLPATITIGTSGISLGATANPAALINAGTTTIGAGLIELSGATTLSSWQSGTDTTKIAGGSIEADTISANVLNIGMRGLTITGCEISFNASSSLISWNTGTISYVDDTGAYTTISITAGSYTYTGTGEVWIYWTKSATTISTNTVSPISAQNVVFATYSLGSGLVVTYGGTKVDGSNIATGSIQAAQIAAGSITADRIAVGTITATEIAVGTITATQIATGTITASNIAGGTITATQIASGAGIDSTMIANGAITTNQLAANSVTVGKISVASLSGISANIGTITAGVLNSSNLLTDGVTPVTTFSLNTGTLTISDNS